MISINANSLNGVLVKDYGRSTGFLELITDHTDNQGPLVRRNRLANNSLNGMVVRGAVLTTENVWDDADVVHVLFDQIAIPDVHSYGGLRLESSPTESLVVKFQGNDAGFKATGRAQRLRRPDRRHATHSGATGTSMVLTSLSDDSVGAGFDPAGKPQADTDGAAATRTHPIPGSFQIDLNFGPVIRRRPQIMATSPRGRPDLGTSN